MAAEAGGSALGPALFVGLSLFALVTQGEPEVDPNPQTRLADGALRAAAAPEALPVALATGWVSPNDARLTARSPGFLPAGPEAEPAVLASLAPPRPIASALQGALAAPLSGAGATLPPYGQAPTPQRSAAARMAQPQPDAPATAAARPAQPAALTQTAPLRAAPEKALPLGTGSAVDRDRAIRQAPGLTRPSAGAAWHSGTRPNWHRLTADRVFLRDAPGLQAQTIGLFPLGTFADVTGTEGNWTQVTIAGQTGWIWGRYLTRAAPM